MLTESLLYFTMAIDIGGQNKSEILMHRACAYEALGMREMQVRDMRTINEVDGGFRVRYMEESNRLEREGFIDRAEKIRLFLQKMDWVVKR